MVSTSNVPSKTATGDAPSEKTGKAPVRNDAQRKVPPSKPQPRSRPTKRKQVDEVSDLTFQIPRRVSVENPLSPNQMILVFAAVVVGLLHVTSNMGSVFKPKGNRKYQRMTSSPVNRWKDRRKLLREMFLDPIIEAILQKDPDAFKTEFETCGVYLSRSSVPESGWGFFAGVNYTVGENIRVEHFQPLQGVAPWSLLLTPHSVLSNVKWEDSSSSPAHGELGSSVLIATRDIAKGEEFFLSWDNYFLDKSSRSSFTDVLANMPSTEHFLRADEHIREARSRYFGVINYTKLEEDAAKPKGKRKKYATSNARWNRNRDRNYNRNGAQLYKPESAKVIETGLRLWQSAVEIYDPLVAKLLPTKAKTLAMYHQRAVQDKSLFSSSSLLGSLKNQTIRSLDKATCVSFLEWQPATEPNDESTIDGSTEAETQDSCASTSHYKQVVAREDGFFKGEIVGVVPLLAMQKSDAQERSSCLSLSSLSSSPEVVICPLGGIHEYTRDADVANVEYRWNNNTMSEIPSKVKSLFTQSVLVPSLSLEEEEKQKEILLQKFPLSMSWDIVALRDIKQNETVVLYQPEENTPL